MLKITSAEIIVSALRLAHMPTDALPELVLLGRSNVGKSSLVNAMLGRRAMARISSRPGKTRLLNFYRINEQFYLVDVPGYGYAKIPQTERAALRERLYDYLTQRQQIRLVLQLVDFRHLPSKDDVLFHALIRDSRLPFRVVATKADKVARSQHRLHTQKLLKFLSLEEGQLIITSSQDKSGLDLLWSSILTHLPQ
ncbi:MAG: putative GTP-binding protein EngB [Firmicutes bacterium]|nr:putative GTP-binding protein EngB [Bacillota bacterium]MBT9157927.1 putative GTP-binding protein EngB [Bacillota bacterium]